MRQDWQHAGLPVYSMPDLLASKKTCASTLVAREELVRSQKEQGESHSETYVSRHDTLIVAQCPVTLIVWPRGSDIIVWPRGSDIIVWPRGSDTYRMLSYENGGTSATLCGPPSTFNY